ncbi:unnamed protein product [Closterium sp. NIES-54]
MIVFSFLFPSPHPLSPYPLTLPALPSQTCSELDFHPMILFSFPTLTLSPPFPLLNLKPSPPLSWQNCSELDFHPMIVFSFRRCECEAYAMLLSKLLYLMSPSPSPSPSTSPSTSPHTFIPDLLRAGLPSNDRLQLPPARV